MNLFRVTLLAVALLLAPPALAQTTPAAKPSSTDMEIFRQKIKADKKLVVATNMQLTEAEAKAFWPVYDAYQKDLEQVNQRLAKLIKDYADAWNKGTVSNETAGKLANELIAIEDAEVKMKHAYLPKLQKAVSGMKAARYLQIENKIRAAIRYELAANIPLVE